MNYKTKMDNLLYDGIINNDKWLYIDWLYLWICETAALTAEALKQHDLRFYPYPFDFHHRKTYKEHTHCIYEDIINDSS